MSWSPATQRHHTWNDLNGRKNSSPFQFHTLSRTAMASHYEKGKEEPPQCRVPAAGCWVTSFSYTPPSGVGVLTALLCQHPSLPQLSAENVLLIPCLVLVISFFSLACHSCHWVEHNNFSVQLKRTIQNSHMAADFISSPTSEGSS